MKITIGGNTFEGDNIEINGSRVKKGEILSMRANIDGVDVEFGRNTYTNHPEYDRGFCDGQQSKQAEIDELKSKVQELWTELDDRQSKEHIIEKCETIIQEILK